MRIKNFSLLIFLYMVSGVSSVYSGPIAEGKEKFLGNVVGFSIPADFSNYWNQVTPENFGKWGNIEYVRDSMFWEPLKNAYDFAKRNGYPFKEHTFIWGRQEPSWIGKLSPKEQKEEIEEFIRLFAENFPNTDFVDVVNEPLNTPASYKEALGGAGSTGWDWIVWAYQKARQYLPNTKLLINEYGIVNSSKNTDKYLKIINILKKRNLIDGIGVQSHCFSLQGTKPEVIKSNLDKLAATGLPIYSSELDLQGDDQLQKSRYWQYFPIFWEHPDVKGVTLWGYRYKRTWMETTWLKDTNDLDRPALTWLRNYVSTGERGEDSLGYFIVKNPIVTYIDNNCIRIRTAKPVLLELFNINGARVSSMIATDKNMIPFSSFNASSGIYLLRADHDETIRLVIPGWVH